MRRPALTEPEWLACAHPERMLNLLRAKGSERKLRLFAVACCRRIQPLLSDPRSRIAIDAAEQYADGKRDHPQLCAARQIGAAAHKDAFDKCGKRASCLEWAAEFAADLRAFHAAKNVSWMSATTRVDGEATPADYPTQATFMRDIFGNPFRPIGVDPAHVPTNVITLAKTIYNDRTFDRMPELADALETANCTDADILAHCRSGREHVRGCWVVDLLLRRK